MSVICQNFVQNAWKKELCSNCFKSKDEHNLTSKKLKPLPMNDDINCKITGIMKTRPTTTNCKKSPRRTVCFPNELIEIIGVGGEDWLTDDDDDDNEDNNNSEDDEDDGLKNDVSDENDGELQRITKENTDFNMSSLGNVIEVKTTTKCYNNLLLGKPIVDSEGKKQTLLVTVTPFGEEPKKFNSISKNHKESLTETKTKVVLTSYTSKSEEEGEKDKIEEKSLLEEINETLEQNKTSASIQIISRKRIQQQNNNIVNKDNLNFVNKPVEKRVNLTRTPALKRDQEKPVINVIQTLNTTPNNTKIELLNIMNNVRKTQTPEVNNNNIKETENKTSFSQSREQAGEPDGRADDPRPETTITELPALPLTPPPPLESQLHFTNNNNNNVTSSGNAPVVFYENKPQIPSKPTVLIRKPVCLTTFQVIPSSSSSSTTTLENKSTISMINKHDTNESDLIRNKRRAPKPPPSPSADNNNEMTCKMLQPEPAPRKILSVSTDNLILNENINNSKIKPKNRFSLKKFLRMGNNNNNNNTKELTKSALDLRQQHQQEFYLQHPQPKPRIVIVHPSELTGAEIITKPTTTVLNNNNNIADGKIINNKPPPPPRNDDLNKLKPIPSPKSNEILQKQRQLIQQSQPHQIKLSNNINNNNQKETVYANIGEVRSSLVPNKPQRTASMREREEKQRKTNNELYDYINSSPEQSPKRLNKRSESSIDVSGEYFKENLPRTMSLTYCGSETESEIYAPYSFYGGAGSESEGLTEDEHHDFCWPTNNGRTHKLRARKGRSIVHKNLEDNYGAVVVANHEALAQVLENVQQTNNNHIPNVLRGLKTMENLRWSDFTINLNNNKRIFVGKCVFYQAIWQMQHVTLCVSTGITNSITLKLGNCILTPITEFSDLIPYNFLSVKNLEEYCQPAAIQGKKYIICNTI